MASAPAGHADAPQAHAYWSYEDDTGPLHWATLSAEYAGCAIGTEQSPIDLSDARVSTLPEIVRSYSAASVRIVHHEHIVDVIDNGHTIQINYDEGSVLDVGGEQFELVQYHFHAPSEHTVDGRHYPMEMHLVHRSETGHLAVIGVLIAEGAHNTAFDPVWANLPSFPGAQVHLEHLQVDIDDLLPATHRTWRYRGSLTTPPCSEGVEWIVMHDPVTLSSAQIAAFTAIFDGNNRPVQAVGSRSIVLDQVPEEVAEAGPQSAL
ncbi:MAG TPA: carbonic anhydrase family protein [Pseudomonadales bacterium]|nr:carbonic anhydrase family protein [Pseudomonadales bacterium]